MLEISRRRVLLAAAGIVAIACAPKEAKKSEGIESAENPFIKLSTPEKVPLGTLQDLPDIQTPIFTNSQGELAGFVTAGQSSYPISVDRKSGKLSLASAMPVIGPDTSPERKWYRNGYTGISSVVQPSPDNPDLLVGMLDCEQHALDASGNPMWEYFRGRVAYATSSDGGKTWRDNGVIIEGYDPIEPGRPSPKAENKKRPTGAIHPWAIKRVVDGRPYLYIYYTDLTSDMLRPNQVCLSRCPIDMQGNLGSQELWTKQGFVKGGEKQGIEPQGVFKIPPWGIYTAIPTVYAVGREFLAIHESELGFYLARSKDGVSWSDSQQIVRFPRGINDAKAQGGKWFSNPTLFSPDQPNNTILGKTGYMLFSEGVFNSKPHQMQRMKFAITI